MNLILIFSVSFITAFSGALAPGPLLFFTIAKSSQNGGWTGFFVVLGHAILELIIVLILLLGLQNFINKNLLETILSLIGGLLLITMGVMTLIPVLKKIQIKEINISNEDKDKKNIFSLISGGFIMSLSNPYFLLWWLVIGAGYLFTALKFGLIGVIIFFIGHILADFIWYVIISQFVYRTKKIIPQKVYSIISILCSVLIIIIGFLFTIKGIKMFF